MAVVDQEGGEQVGSSHWARLNHMAWIVFWLPSLQMVSLPILSDNHKR